MKYLRRFQTNAQYTEYIEGDAILPNVSSIVETESVEFNPYVAPPAAVGDVAYWDGSKVKTISSDEWSSSLGTPVGVVVIPEGMLPDGKARIVALNHSKYNDVKYMVYSTVKNDSVLANYRVVPITKNTDNYANSTNYFGYLPSDSFTGKQSFCDPEARYSTTSSYISPSPYLNGAMNPEYYKETTGGGNALSDFNGLSNTRQLCNLGNEYVAANTAYNIDEYGLEWYLPGCGELGFLFVRRKQINNTLSLLTDDLIANANRVNYWSSTEFSLESAYGIISNNAGVDDLSKTSTCLVRSFAIID